MIIVFILITLIVLFIAKRKSFECENNKLWKSSKVFIYFLKQEISIKVHLSFVHKIFFTYVAIKT